MHIYFGITIMQQSHREWTCELGSGPRPRNLQTKGLRGWSNVYCPAHHPPVGGEMCQAHLSPCMFLLLSRDHSTCRLIALGENGDQK